MQRHHRDKSFGFRLLLLRTYIVYKRSAYMLEQHSPSTVHSLLQLAAVVAVVVDCSEHSAVRCSFILHVFRVSSFGPASSPFRTENFKGNFNCSGRADNASIQSSIPVFGPTSSQPQTLGVPQVSFSVPSVSTVHPPPTSAHPQWK